MAGLARIGGGAQLTIAVITGFIATWLGLVCIVDTLEDIVKELKRINGK